jgi:hypothetical protein
MSGLVQKMPSVEEQFQQLLNIFCQDYKNRFFPSQSVSRKVDLIFANGRFHGLWPSDAPGDFYGGHPGLFYHLLVNALCLDVKNVLIMMSIKYEGPGSQYPIPAATKYELIVQILDVLKNAMPQNIVSYLMEEKEITISNVSEFELFLQGKIQQIGVHIGNMTNPFALLSDFVRQKFTRGSVLIKPNVLMITGLEEKYNKKTGQTTWYNKYESVFAKLSPETISSIEFLLLKREGGISGTVIRGLVNKREYAQLAQHLQRAGIPQDQLITWGKTIRAIKGPDIASQLSQEYADTLASNMSFSDKEEEEKESNLESAVDKIASLNPEDYNEETGEEVEEKGGKNTRKYLKRKRKTKRGFNKKRRYTKRRKTKRRNNRTR